MSWGQQNRNCKYCNGTITFHFDEGIGKSYPVNTDGSSHDCMERARSNSRNCNGCGAPIFWHSSMMGPKGGKIPLDVGTTQAHQCPAKSMANAKSTPDTDLGDEWRPNYGSEFRS